MKKYILTITIIFSVIFISCAVKKNKDADSIYGGTWELEYISGPRISFEGLFPDRKPQISFDKASGEVSGNNSCNGYSAKYNLQGNDITFGEPGPTTMMYCGQGEQQFLNMMKKINQYSIDKDGKLNLMMNEVPMMRFKNIDGPKDTQQ